MKHNFNGCSVKSTVTVYPSRGLQNFEVFPRSLLSK